MTDPDGPIVPGVKPILIWDHSKIIQVSCGANHTLMLTEDRQVLTFGRNTFGRLGIDVSEVVSSVLDPTVVEEIRPGNLIGDDTVCFVEAGEASSFAVTERGDLYVWGANEKAQLGLGFESESVRIPTLVATPFRACEVAAGDGFVLAYDVYGDVWGWGGPYKSPFLHGTNESAAFYENLKRYERPVMLAAGRQHAIMLLGNGSVFGVGANTFGQLGVDGPNFVSPILIEALSQSKITSVFANADYTVVHSVRKHPMNCACARGGRGPTKFGVPGAVPIPVPQPKPQVTQPKPVPSQDFGPVSPRSLIPSVGGHAMPGEVAETHVRSVENPLEIHRIANLANNNPRKQDELAPSVANVAYYPEDSVEAKVWSAQGVVKGEQQVFGKHVSDSGYFYGDDPDANVMPASGNVRAMPNFQRPLTPHKPVVPEDLYKVFSLSLQDVKRPAAYGDEQMRRAQSATVKELQDHYQPPEFHQGDDDWGFSGKPPNAKSK